MVGNDPGSTVYVRNKSKACEKVGIEFEEFYMMKTYQNQIIECYKKIK